MKRKMSIAGAVIVALTLPMTVPALAVDKASLLEPVHVRAARADTAAEHAAVARDYRLQAEAFAAKAAAHEKEAAQLTRASGAMIHKWPAMASRQLQNEKAKALEARRAELESRALADRHIRLAVEAHAKTTASAAE